jgi:hypothetical protein
VVSDLTDVPAPGEAAVTIDGIDLVLGSGVDGTLDAGDHNVLLLL